MNSAIVLRSPVLAAGTDARVVRLYRQAPPLRYARGGLAQAAEKVRAGGRGDDHVLLHITQEEFDHLKGMWGEPDVNPNTGLPEYGFLSKLWKKVKKVIKKIAPYAGILTNIFLPGIGALGNALIQGASGAVTGGGKGALAGLVTGGLGGAGGKIGTTLGLKGATAKLAGDAIVGGAASKIGGGSFGSGAIRGAAMGAAMPALQKIGAGVRGAIGDTSIGRALGIPGTPTAAAPAYDELLAAGEVGPPKALVPQEGPPKPLGVGAPAGPAVSGGGLGSLGSNVLPLALLGGALGSGKQKTPEQPQLPPGWTSHLPQLQFNRQSSMPMQDWYTYGMRPEEQFYSDNALPEYNPEEEEPRPAARGGALFQSHRLVRGPGTGRSDSISAKLSDGEYVLTAEDVALIGDGSTDAGAKRLDQWRTELRRHKGQALAKGKISPNAKKPGDYLKRVNKRG